jgi:hypothetical protein
MKYISTEKLGFIIFDDRTSHRVIAEAVLTHGDELLSAGFVTLRNDQLVAYGKSDSVNMSSLPTDTEAIIRHLNNLRKGW